MASKYDTSIYALQCGDDHSIEAYVRNLTSSYTGTSDEYTVVATSVIMFVLAATFFNLNLFSRVSDISAVLNPTIKLVLSTALSLFLPVMSYLFSEAKKCAIRSAGDNARGRVADLPVRARLILTWMLLVELLRKKVLGILVTAGMQESLSASITSQVTSVLWLGNLVFFNLKASGRRAVFGILWVLCAAKLVQRVVNAKLGKSSMAHGKNTRILCSYMPQMLRAEGEKNGQQHAEAVVGSARMAACKYVVMGEEKMVLETGPHGYRLDLGKIDEENGVVTVGKIWKELAKVHADVDDRPLSRSSRARARLKRLSLSFALFKLLRRRFEPVPAAPTQQETDDCRDLIFKGLCREEGVAADPAEPEVALFQVINDELNFLCEYYHSVLPVMFASPYFIVVNYFLVPAVVFGICTMTVILSGNGNISYSLGSIKQDNYALSIGIIKLTRCLWRNAMSTPAAFFATVDISISYLLFLAFLYEEVWEFIIVLLSNWFSMSLLCNYTAKRSWQESPTIRGALRRISWVHQKLSDTRLIMCKQFSVLNFCWLSITLPALPLPKQAKRSIMRRLMAFADDARASPLSNGSSALLLGQQHYSPLSRFCESNSVAEVILTWHIATSLMDNEFPPLHKRGTTSSGSGSGSGVPHHDQTRMVATMLSNYCAYLLAFHPELLPDDQEGTKKMYEGMKKDLKKALGSWGYFLWPRHRRYTKLIDGAASLKGKADSDMTVVEKGVLLANELVELVKGEQPIWELLGQFWVELVVYIGPSGSGEHEKAHEEALAQGGELVTLLWALTTQTGITRPPVDTLPVATVEEEMHPSSV
uniref:Uncharacterized protein n=1 Tax=Avena sativa TaxID=4498 RepID=A0ACD5VLW5_AVESA